MSGRDGGVRTDQVRERWLDWGLGEIVGGVAPPDVTSAVLQRFAAGEVVDAGSGAGADACAEAHDHVHRSANELAEDHEDENGYEGAHGHGHGSVLADPLLGTAAAARNWLRAAAVLLLGLGTVFVAWLATQGQHRSPHDDASSAAPAPQDGELRELTDAADITDLAADTRAIALRDLDDRAVAALVLRCPRLEHLRVFASTAYRREDRRVEPVSITDAALRAIASLNMLRRLELIGTAAVQGETLGALTRLPVLAELTLSHFDLDDAALQALPQLSALRSLDLSLNHGFGDAGMAAVARCAGLRRLVLTACSQLEPASIARLGALAQLEELVLSAIGRHARGVASAEIIDGNRIRVRTAGGILKLPMQTTRAHAGSGLTVAGLPGWPRLLRLDLSNNFALEASVGRILRERCGALVALSLANCPQVDDVTVAHLLALPHLRTLDLSRCERISEPAFELMCASTQLREVRIDEPGAWLTLELARSMFARGILLRAQRKDDPEWNRQQRALVDGLAAERR